LQEKKHTAGEVRSGEISKNEQKRGQKRDSVVCFKWIDKKRPRPRDLTPRPLD
jgi:hypothetical protein